MQKHRAQIVALVVVFKAKAIYIQPALTFSNSTLETKEQCVKSKCVFKS